MEGRRDERVSRAENVSFFWYDTYVRIKYRIVEYNTVFYSKIP